MNKKNYCIACGKEISYYSAHYGNHKCSSCAKMGHKTSKETREKIRQSLKGRKRPKISKLMKAKGNHRPKCFNCGKILYNYNAKYCWDCYILLGLNRGISASNYIHGLSPQKYPSEFNRKLKGRIRERDDFTCQICGMTEEEHLIVYGQNLEIHHIDYIIENCDEENLITLCKQCNIRANYNRKYWIEFFKNKMSTIKVRRK